MTTDTAVDQDWVTRLKDVCDSTLRSVVRLTEQDRDVLYVRDDIDPDSTHRQAHAFQTLLVDTRGKQGDEDTSDHAELVCVSRRFEDAIELHFPVSATTGVAVGLDSTAMDQMDDPVPHLHSIVANSE